MKLEGETLEQVDIFKYLGTLLQVYNHSVGAGLGMMKVQLRWLRCVCHMGFLKESLFDQNGW